MKQNIFWNFLLLSIGIVFFSCGGNDDEEYVDNYLTVTPSYIKFPASGGTQVLQVLSNITWSVSVEEGFEWIQVGAASSGNGSLIVAALANETTVSRTGMIDISGEKVAVYQDAGNGSYPGTGGGTSNTGGGTTKLPAPKNLDYTLEKQSNGTIYVNLRWDKVEGATTYKVYLAEKSSGPFELRKEITSNNTVERNPNKGDNYFKVAARNSNGEGEMSAAIHVYVSSNSGTGGGTGGGSTGTSAPGAPQVSASGTSSSITLSWVPVSGSNYGKPTSYDVYKRDPNTANYNKLTSTSSTRYTDTNPHPGYNRYAVVAKNSAGSSSQALAISPEIPLNSPTSFSATRSGDYIKFSWSKVSAATGYQLFVSSTASGSYTIIEQVDDVSTTSKTVYYPSDGQTKYFKIKAYWMTEYGGSPIYSNLSSYKSIK